MGWGWVKLKQSYGTNMLIQTVQLTISILHVMKYKIYTRNNNIIYLFDCVAHVWLCINMCHKGKNKHQTIHLSFFFKKEKEMFILLFKSFFPLIMKNKSISNSSAYVILSFVEILCIQGRARITAGVKRRKVFVCGIALLI